MTTATHTTTACDPATSTTRSLLGYGVLAGPFYAAASLVQAATRDGFDLTRHQWSLLALGEHGWVQTANFVLTGLMIVAAAVGLRRALRSGRGATWGPRLIAVYGISLVAAAAFPADPALGFPAGTPEGPGDVSWHGMLHFVAAGVGFACLAGACFLLARRFGSDGRRGWAVGSRCVGAAFLTGFAAVASGGGSVAATVAFTVAVLTVFTWLSAVSVHLYRRR